MDYRGRFVVREKTRFNDVFCFTIYPDPPSFEGLLAEVGFFIPRDLKKVKSIQPLALSYMTSGRTFSFCFILERGRIVQNPREIDATIERTMEMISAWPSNDFIQSLLIKFSAIRQKLKANGFKRHLLFDIVVYAAIAGFLAFLLRRYSRPTFIMLTPDRDDMVRSFDRIAGDLFVCNFSSLCEGNGIDGRDVQLGLWNGGDSAAGADLDPLLRIPDFIAGSVAAWDVKRNVVLSHHPKVQQVIDKVVAENPDVALMRLSFGMDETSAARLVVRRGASSPVST